MSESSRDSDVRNYYQSQQMSEAKVKALIQAGDSAREARRWRTVAIAAVITALTTSAVLVFQLTRPDRSKSIAGQSESNNGSLDSGAVTKTDQERNQRDVRFRFVAVRSHDDNCPHCRATGELFTNYSQQFRNRPVDFELIKLHKQDESERTRDRVQDLNLSPFVKDQPETAFAFLMSPGGDRLQRFAPLDDPELNRRKFIDIIDQ